MRAEADADNGHTTSFAGPTAFPTAPSARPNRRGLQRRVPRSRTAHPNSGSLVGNSSDISTDIPPRSPAPTRAACRGQRVEKRPRSWQRSPSYRRGYPASSPAMQNCRIVVRRAPRDVTTQTRIGARIVRIPRGTDTNPSSAPLDVCADPRLSSRHRSRGSYRVVSASPVRLRGDVDSSNRGRGSVDVLLAVPELLLTILYGCACEPPLGAALRPLRTGALGMKTSNLPLGRTGTAAVSIATSG